MVFSSLIVETWSVTVDEVLVEVVDVDTDRVVIVVKVGGGVEEWLSFSVDVDFDAVVTKVDEGNGVVLTLVLGVFVAISWLVSMVDAVIVVDGFFLGKRSFFSNSSSSFSILSSSSNFFNKASTSMGFLWPLPAVNRKIKKVH